MFSSHYHHTFIKVNTEQRKRANKATAESQNSSPLCSVIVLVSKRVHMWVFLSTRLLTFLAFTVITQKSNFTEQVKRKIHSEIQRHGSGVDLVIAAETTTWMWMKYAQIKLTRTRNIKSS